MTLSRRDILTGGLARDRQRASGASKPGAAPAWVPLGRLADFPPGSVTELPSGVRVESLPEGLRVIGRAGEIRPARIERNGTLASLDQGSWPANTFLSVFTGQPLSLDESSPIKGEDPDE
jgi:hypothetical protein